MKKSGKVIITCAITGSIHTPSMSPYLPITADQIADEAIAAAEAGAAIVHLHARDPTNGRPDQSPDLFAAFLPRIKQATDAIVNITTGGGAGMLMKERLAPALHFAPEIASMNMGSFNFNLSGLVEGRTDFQFDWERPYLEQSRDAVLSNTFAQIDHAMTVLGEKGTRFEFECYDTGHLYTLAHFANRGLIKPPYFIQCIFGISGGIAARPENLMHMRSICDDLFGEDYLLSVIGAGRHQLPFATMCAILGGNVRVGLEDSLYISHGQLANSNAQQVAKIRRIVEELGMEIATPAQARLMLATKGGDRVEF